jgi:hypothetical protein
VYFTRQFSLWNEREQRYIVAAEAADEGILGFAFGFQFPREHEARLGEFMLWSKDFGSREEFLNAVEAAACFQLALSLTPVRTALTVECPLVEPDTGVA